MGYDQDDNKNNIIVDKEIMDISIDNESILDEKPDHLIHDDDDDQDQDVHVFKETYQKLEEYYDSSIYDKIKNLKWNNLIILLTLHLAFIVCYIQACANVIHLKTALFALTIGFFSGLGMSVGAHRLYAHRSFKAHWLLKLFLLIFQTMTMNGSAFSYARDHRTHHKFTDTNLDPKNPSRGLFYSHVGWWLQKKSSVVKQAGSKLDFSDLRNDPLVWFQHKHYSILFFILGIILPTLIPVYFWNEDPLVAFGLCTVIRITVVLHHLFTVNSVAHFFGHRPYDFRIRPRDHRLINYLSFGEGNHNYHHVFPYDYRANERPQWEIFNPVTLFIQINSLIGLVYGQKIASKQVVEGTIKRVGGKVQRDKPTSLTSRIINATIDWIIGLLVVAWPIYPALIYKLINRLPIYI